MSAIDEKNISRYLVNPFSVKVADVGDSIPSEASFHTLPAITFNFNREFVASQSYNECSGILYTVRQDLRTFDFRVSFSIQETTINIIKISHGGTIDSTGNTIVLDGTITNYAWWFESCYNDDSKIIRVTVPQAKNVDSSTAEGGESPYVHANNIQALPDIDDATTLPSIYIEP